MSDKANKRFFLIDGNSFCYRAFYAVRHLSNSKGQPTNAIYGFITMIKKIIKDENPDMLAIAFDLKGPTFRHKKFKEYKITRKPMPDDLVSQIPYIKKFVRAYNIPIFELEGYEADDVLATLAYKAGKRNIDVFIVTSDKDALQLVGPHVKVYNPHKDGIIYGTKEVEERFGVPPRKITDLMALMGDTSDNIPGVPGIGEKTAVELMKKFKDLNDILENTAKIKSQSRRKKIENAKTMALMSKELATIRTDVPIDVDIANLSTQEPNKEALLDLFKELEFRSLLKEVIPKSTIKKIYKLVDSKENFKKLVNALKKVRSFTFDFETTHYDPMQATAVGVSFCFKEQEAHYIPLNALRGIRKEYVFGELKPIFEDKKIKKVAQNIKYDLLILKNVGIDLKGMGFDTMVASYLLNPSKSKHNLSDIALEHLGRSKTSIEEIIGKGRKAITMDQADVQKVCDYCCEDSDITYCLQNILEKKIKEKELDELYFKVEMPLVDVLADMEFQGISVDVKYLSELSASMEIDMKSREKKIYELAGETFNINSPKQLQDILFNKLKMPIIKRTKTGASTDEEVLKTLSQKEKLPAEILRYRELSKLRSTYVDNLPELINPRTGRVHTSFNQTVTATGRLSSSNPNIQNIPIKTDMGRKIRKAFVAGKKDHLILSADYSQVELRILAHLSGDRALLGAFREDSDIHTFTASLIYGTSENSVTKEMRQVAKTVNFGIVYGMSAYGLSRDLGIEVSEAAKFIDAYFERYPEVKDYLKSKIEDAKKNGFVTTILGRRRYIPEINSPNTSVSNFAKRTAVNTPIQGSAADLIKIAMINIYKALSKFSSKMILQVHDELVFEVHKKELKEVANLVKAGMEGVMDLEVPIKVELEAGGNWLDMEKIEI